MKRQQQQRQQQQQQQQNETALVSSIYETKAHKKLQKYVCKRTALVVLQLLWTLSNIATLFR